jgi:hypothetical protein
MAYLALSDAEHDALPSIEWLILHDHEDLIAAALERVACGCSSFSDARLLAFEIGLAHHAEVRA